MHWLLLLLLPLVSKAYIYEVTVIDAQNLNDVDPDFIWSNENDGYVEIFAKAANGNKTERTSIIEGDNTPEWNEKFTFDDDADGIGAYISFQFTVMDDDSTAGSDVFNKADLLGRTEAVLTSEVIDCTEIFSDRLTLTNDDGATCGTLFVTITEDGCNNYENDNENENENDNENENEDEDENETETTRKPGGKGGKAVAAGNDNMDDSVDDNNDDSYDDDDSCLVGDIRYMDGDRIGSIGDTCLDDRFYSGTQSVCVDGEVKEYEYGGDCNGDNPGSRCCQQGAPGSRGGAVCVTQCTPVTSDGSCSVGGINYYNGQRIGTVGKTCVDRRFYNGAQFICTDGEVKQVEFNGDCKGRIGTKCCQQGEPDTVGAAVCIPEESCVEYSSNPTATTRRLLRG